MLVKLVPVGDKRGLPLSPELLEQSGITDAVEVIAEKGRLILQPVRATRRQWEEAIASLLESIDGAAGIGEVPDLPRQTPVIN